MEIPTAYSVADLTILIGVISTAFSTMIITILTAWRNSAKLHDTTLEIKANSLKVDTIVDKVNGNFSKQREEIAALLSQVTALTAKLAEKEKDRTVVDIITALVPEGIKTVEQSKAEDQQQSIIIKP